MFSSRLPARFESNAIARALDRARTAGRPLIDLTVSNPTRVGITHPPAVFRALATPKAAVYTPEPFGLRRAREAVADEYARRGLAIPWERIVLTSSTSEAYSLLFKLLCDPCGDSVLVPAPSYPLFEHLTALDGVAARVYRLDYDDRWSLDLDSVDRGLEARTKAVLAVSPNNPTGSVVSRPEYAALRDRCASRGVALILDEVFADYMLDPLYTSGEPDAQPQHGLMTFRLGGLSKSAALPQVKLGWIAVEGSEEVARRALERLELICDTYLSVSTPVQIAAPDLIGAGAHARRRVLERVRFNYAQLRQAARAHPSIEVLHAEGGWSAVMRIPSRETEEQFVLDLLDRDGVVVHPGFFFDFSREAYLILSLLPEPETFLAGVRRVLEHADA